MLDSNLSSVTDYIAYGNNVTLTNYEDDVKLFNAFDEGSVNYVVVPKNRYLREIINKDLLNYLINGIRIILRNNILEI